MKAKIQYLLFVLKQSYIYYIICMTGRFWLETRATGFKPQRVNCWEINQVTSKCQMDFLQKTCKDKSKTKKVKISIEFYIFELV